MQLRLVGDADLPKHDSPSFDTFWSIYPRHRAKPIAFRAWLKLSEKEQREAIDAVPRHLAEWRNEGDIRFVPYPATFLNQRRWEDDLDCKLEARPCRWKGCQRAGTQQRGSGFYCEGHVAALNRGETP